MNENKTWRNHDEESKKCLLRLLEDQDVITRIRALLSHPPYTATVEHTLEDRRRELTVGLDSNRITLFLAGSPKPLSLSDPVQCLITTLAFNGFGGYLEPKDWQDRINDIFDLCGKGKQECRWLWLHPGIPVANISEKMRQVRDKVESWLHKAGVACRIVPMAARSGFEGADWQTMLYVKWGHKGLITDEFPYGEFPEILRLKFKANT
ncbi:MAG: hypothetical protein J6S87_00605 [Bacteroidales bacterium]|nr:hypothetical protein [Bacteroidales bacterium]